ncbi:MAG: hypothetical protein Q8N99_04030 [Nanoarchaeota archaeon]|nr:hypothetical protein [Nanoarchaeota archaeon]
MVKLDFERISKEREKEYEAQQIARQECISSGSHIGNQLKVLPYHASGQGYFYLTQCSHCNQQYERQMNKSEEEEFERSMRNIKILSGLEHAFA